MTYILKYSCNDEPDDSISIREEIESKEKLIEKIKSLGKMSSGCVQIQIEEIYIKSDINIDQVNGYIETVAYQQDFFRIYGEIKSNISKLEKKKEGFEKILENNRKFLNNLGIKRKEEEISKIEKQIVNAKEKLSEVQKQLDSFVLPEINI